MKTKRVIKKDILKRTIIFTISVCAFIFVVKMINFYTSDYYKLTKLGYSKEASKKIVELKKSNEVLKRDYNDKMLDILEAKYYIHSNLDNYISYYNEHKDKDIDDIIAIVNVHADNEFYAVQFDTDTSKGTAMLVNKFYTLSSGYEPEEIVSISNWYAYANNSINKEVYDQFKKMFNAAKKEDLKIIINDSYRSYSDQEETYEKYGDEYAARPGSSEHNTGLAIDVVSPSSNGDPFKDTAEHAWLQEHAHEYGFILRYPENKEYLTGYAYESWHYRYLGVELATKVYESGLTYEEYYAYYIEANN